MISSQQLGERLADARKRARLTQAEVADRMGFARTTLVAIEKGERRPSDGELVRLGEILNVPIHDLLRETLVRAENSPRFRVRGGANKEPGPVAEPKVEPEATALLVPPSPFETPELKLHSVEAMLRERQRAFIELVTTTETLRMKIARLEEILEERDRELTRLRVARAS